MVAGGAAGCLSKSGAGGQTDGLCRQTYPPLSGRVVDEAHIIDPEGKVALTEQLSQLEARTGHQLVVATTPSLEDKPIEEFSLCLARHWGIGRKGIDDGVMLLIAPSEQKVRIEVGYGLERALTDPEAKAIIETDIIPSFKRGDLRRGITAGVTAIAREISAPPSGIAR